MLYTGLGAHKLTNFNPFLALQAQIQYGGVSISKDLSGKFYIGAHLQYSSYKMLDEVMRTNFSAIFAEICKNLFLPISAKIAAPANTGTLTVFESCFFLLKNASNFVKIDQLTAMLYFITVLNIVAQQICKTK